MQFTDCGAPEQPTNGAVSYTVGTKYDAIATQSCNIGFEISGSLTIKCLANGVWSAGPVTCTLICEYILNLKHLLQSF